MVSAATLGNTSNKNAARDARGSLNLLNLLNYLNNNFTGPNKPEGTGSHFDASKGWYRMSTMLMS